MDAQFCKAASDSMPPFTEASSEEKLLQSYDRFYKAVNKLAFKDVDPLPPREAVVCGAQKLPEDALKAVWERAERFGQLQNVAQRFGVYRSDLVKKWKQRSRTESMSSTEVEEGMKDLLQNQNRLEQQMNFMNAVLIGVDHRTEQLPSFMEKMLKQRDDVIMQENQTLKKMVVENQKKIDRLEQLLMRMDAKLNACDRHDCEGLKYTSGSWPDLMRNNIAYSIGSSSLEGSNSRPISAVSSEEDVTSETPLRQNSAHEIVKPEMIVPLTHLSSCAETVCAEGKGELVEIELATDLEAKHGSSISNPFFNGESSASPPSTALTRSAFSNSSFNKVVKSMEATKGRKQGGHEQEKRGMSADFNEAFLEDALRVQENILTSTLGHLTQDIIQPSIPENDHSPTAQSNNVSSNKTEHSDDGTGGSVNE